MGAVGAWIKVLVGFFIIGAAFIFTQPLFDFLFAIGVAMGGNAETLATKIDAMLTYIPIVMCLSFVLWGFIEATSSENTGIWR